MRDGNLGRKHAVINQIGESFHVCKFHNIYDKLKIIAPHFHLSEYKCIRKYPAQVYTVHALPIRPTASQIPSSSSYPQCQFD